MRGLVIVGGDVFGGAHIVAEHATGPDGVVADIVAVTIAAVVAAIVPAFYGAPRSRGGRRTAIRVYPAYERRGC
jgi:hypothetical protein